MKKRKITSKLLGVVLLLSIVFLTSCGGGNMTDETARAELERLLPISYELNEIFWGKGLPYVDDGSGNRYMPVSPDCPYQSVNDILDKASTVFAEEYLNDIKGGIFTDGDGFEPRYFDLNGVLMVDKTNVGFNVKGNVLIETAKIKDQNRGMCVVKAEYADGGKTEISLVLSDGVWYLNSPSY